MTENRFVLDTNAVIFLTTTGNAIPFGLQDELNEAALFISVITEIELFSKPALPPDEEEKLRSFLSERIPIIDLSSAVKEKTIALRRTTKLKLPDCIVAATSIVLDAVLLTDDDHLLSLSLHGFRVQKIF
ncbi:MAG: type II toxin-antitoxin system VapC family toxin [Treponema sp.]|jgi:predicted nucleic acid-binding protein|nr:type II toxin-antitoxin system VapC family toxin [Treponema sp.]